MNETKRNETKRNEIYRNGTEDRPINNPGFSGSAVDQLMDPRDPKRASLDCDCNFKKQQYCFILNKRTMYILVPSLLLENGNQLFEPKPQTKPFHAELIQTK